MSVERPGRPRAFTSYDQELRHFAGLLDELDEYDGRRILQHLASVVDMVRRIHVRDNWRNRHYRREKALSLLGETLELVQLLAELDGPELDDEATDRLYQARKAWRQGVLDNASGLWGEEGDGG